LPWNFFNDSVFQATGSIVGNAHLIKKVYFPREVLPISIALSNLVNFLIALPVFFILAFIFGAPLTWWALLLPFTIAIQVAFTLGLAFFLATFNVFYRDTQHILGALMLAWFFLTPVVYQIQDVPQQITVLTITFDAQLWLRRLNPMAADGSRFFAAHCRYCADRARRWLPGVSALQSPLRRGSLNGQ
jgi:ABC-type polysaccharide/polyol phosphate export permease